MKNKRLNTPIKYWSIKLPKDGLSYKDGEFPQYTREYLQKHGRKLFELLMNHVPAEVYNEMVKQIKAREQNTWEKFTITTPKSSRS